MRLYLHIPNIIFFCHFLLFVCLFFFLVHSCLIFAGRSYMLCTNSTENPLKHFIAAIFFLPCKVSLPVGEQWRGWDLHQVEALAPGSTQCPDRINSQEVLD